jgi:hypothetical protein
MYLQPVHTILQHRRLFFPHHILRQDDPPLRRFSAGAVSSPAGFVATSSIGLGRTSGLSFGSLFDNSHFAYKSPRDARSSLPGSGTMLENAGIQYRAAFSSDEPVFDLLPADDGLPDAPSLYIRNSGIAP